MVRTAVAFLSLMLLSSVAHSEKRVALIIGNSAYQYTPKLANPRNDATDMAAALEKHGFLLVEGFDLDKAAFERKIRDFATTLEGATAGVFFYAGHGLQVAGVNYLVPVDAQLITAATIEFEMVRADVVQKVMERQTSTNVLFLDACRDNPLARNLARAMGTRSAEIGRGLAATEAGLGTLISYSTQPGNVALDGAGRNSPFAGALVKRIGSSSDDLSVLLIDVRNDVRKETQNKQVPWEHSALTGRFYFNPSSQIGAVAPIAPLRLSEPAEAWNAVKDTTSLAVLEAFIARFKDTIYADLARARAEEMKKLTTVTVPSSAIQPAATEAQPKVMPIVPKEKSGRTKPAEPIIAIPAPTPKSTPNVEKAPNPRLFDGDWTISWRSSNCLITSGSYTVRFANGALESGAQFGRVSGGGAVSWTTSTVKARYRGTFRGNSGSGTFDNPDYKCNGTFTARRN